MFFEHLCLVLLLGLILKAIDLEWWIVAEAGSDNRIRPRDTGGTSFRFSAVANLDHKPIRIIEEELVDG